jgi:hypothetical protein
MSVPTLEEFFTHRDFWGVTTATPVQRAFCRIAQGLPLGGLACDDDVRWSVGGEEALAILTPGGEPPKQLSLYGAVRIGKSDLASCVAFLASQTVGLGPVRSHEIPRIPIISLTLDLGRVTFGHLLGRLQKPSLRALLIEEGADFVVVRHPSGAAVEIKVVAGKRAGGSLISRWNGGAVFDEKPRMMGSDDGAVVNYPDARDAVEGRLLDGAQIIDLGSPWAPWGDAYDDVQERWGKPTPHHVVMRVTGPMGNPSWWTPARCAALQAKNPRAHKTDCLGEFAEGESSALPTDSIDAAIARLIPDGLMSATPILALDLSSLVGRDKTAIAVMRMLVADAASDVPHLFCHATTRGLVREDELQADDVVTIRHAAPARTAAGGLVRNPLFGQRASLLQVAHVEGFGHAGQRATMGAVAARVVELAHLFGATTIALDQHEGAAFSQLLLDRNPSLQPRIFRWSAGAGEGSKTAAVERLRSLLMNGQIALPRHTELRSELARFRRVSTTLGERYEAGRGESHGDHASAVLTGLMADLAGLLDSSALQRSNEPFFYDPYGPND